MINHLIVGFAFSFAFVGVAEVVYWSYKKEYLKAKAKYLREVRQEVSKVTWPSKKETFTSAGIVLIVISIAAVILMLVDQFFSFLVRIVLG